MFHILILGLFAIAEAAPRVAYVPRFATIPEKYIVKFKQNIVSSASMQLKNGLMNRPDREYAMGDFYGFAGTLSTDEMKRLQASNLVDYIEEDSYVSIASIVKQTDATWGLARISQRQPSERTYIYDSNGGEGTCVYIIDTGIDTKHPEFEGRAKSLVDFTDEGNLIDGEGHGTHTAGTVGSKTYGVAKKAKLFAVKVLDSGGSGTNSGVIAGFNYAVNHAKNNTSQCPKGFVANVSLGGSKRQSINEAVREMVEAGIFTAVASGNDGSDASRFSPSSEPSVCTVGATAANDTMPYWSNYGEVVDILAPGLDITSTWPNNNTQTLKGTSMAAPHIAGLGAYFMSLGKVDKDKICEYIQSLATKNAVKGVPTSTVNLVAFNGASG